MHVTVYWFKEHLLQKKVRLTYFLPENSQRKEDQAKINYSVTLHNTE